MLSSEQITEIKKQLLKQIGKFPKDKREIAKQQIESMNAEELESFLKQNNLIKSEEEQKCIFCSIVFGDISSYKIGENKDAVAVLEINPLSKGHSLIIPKKHISSEKEISKETLILAEEIKEKVKKEFDPEEIKIYPSSFLGHIAINILPVYKEEDKIQKKKPAKKEELEEIQKKLIEKKEISKEEQKTTELKDIKLPKRIP